MGAHVLDGGADRGLLMGRQVIEHDDVAGVQRGRQHLLDVQPKPIVDRQFEVEFLDAGVEAFSFTFG